MSDLLLKIAAYLGLWILWIPLSFLFILIVMTPYVLIRALFDQEKYSVALSYHFKSVLRSWEHWGFLFGPPF